MNENGRSVTLLSQYTNLDGHKNFKKSTSFYLNALSYAELIEKTICSLNQPVSQFSLSVAVSVGVFIIVVFPSCNDQNRMDWTLLVEERINKVAKLRTYVH